MKVAPATSLLGMRAILFLHPGARSVVGILLSLLLCSCASLNCTSLESLLGGQADLIKLSYKIADDLTGQASPPLIPQAPEMPVLVTTFANNNHLDTTNRFGLLLQEQISSRLVQQGYSVKEIRMQETLVVEQGAGETILSRDVARIATSQKAQAVLVGTYSRTDRRLYISARLVSPVDKSILSSQDYRLCMDKEMLELFDLKLRDGSKTQIQEPSQPFLNRIL
jgi:TolB-like protein